MRSDGQSGLGGIRPGSGRHVCDRHDNVVGPCVTTLVAASIAAAMADDDFTIEPISEDQVEAFWRAVGAVARERRHLVSVEAFPIESTREFVQKILNGGGVSFVALHNESLIGWCDIVRPAFEGFQHSGKLGMGVLAEYRGRGLGRRLLETAVTAARDMGMTRIELEVFASNTVALELYKKFGFVLEGVKRQARILDGNADDILCMALTDAVTDQ